MREIINTLDPEGAHVLETISKANQFNKWMYDQIRTFLKGNVLEIGSGIGNISKLVIADGFNITLSDYNEEYCNLLRNKFRLQEKVKDVIQIDLMNPAFKEEHANLQGQFESIFMLNVIEHVEDDNKVIENLSFLLNKGGHAIILAPAYNWLYSRFDRELGHFRRYTTTSMTKLISRNANFTIHSSDYFNLAGIAGWFVFSKILNKKLIGSSEMSTFNSMVPLFQVLDRVVFRKMGLSVIAKAIKK